VEQRPSPSASLVVRCECGFEARGTDDEVVEAMQDHAVNAHNMKATREQILARAERA
jgi:predicted small metal-binding protein